MYHIFEICSEGYNARLESQFLRPDMSKKRAYVCSPYSDPVSEKQQENMHRARLYMLYANEYMGYLARAPHAYLPVLLCDKIESERELALRFGLELLVRSDVVLACGTVLSKGMAGEIQHAARLGIPITVFSEALYTKILQVLMLAGLREYQVTLDRKHTVLGLGDALIVPEEGGGQSA